MALAVYKLARVTPACAAWAEVWGLVVCIMCVIFSSRILFSLSISVYLSTNTVSTVWRLLTFKHLVLLEFLFNVPELRGLAHIYTRLCLPELAYVHLPLFLVPLPL